MKKYLILLALLVLTACTDDLVKEGPLADGTYTLTVNASKAPLSKALDLTESTLSASWTAGDKVKVYMGDTEIGELTAQSTGASTTLKGELNETPSGVLTLKYLSPAYSTQDGTLTGNDTSIDKVCDYATASITVKSIDGNNVTIQEASASFTNQQAIVKFTLKEKADGTTPVRASTLTVNAGGSTYTITPSSANDELFVAFPAISSKTVTLTASDGISSYTYEKTGVTFANSKYYEIGVKMTNTTDYLTVPLTFEAREAGSVVSAVSNTTEITTLQYSINGGEWADYSSEITLENIGDKVSFRGTNSRFGKTLNCTKDCYIYGNVMSLITATGFETATSFERDYALAYLFEYNEHIDIHPVKDLKLPATTLTTRCYESMFSSCYHLTKAPDLPAEVLAERCYSKMFYWCHALASAPNLPAETLANSCYESMFSGCVGLTAAPDLPAKTLANSCYESMFQGCTNLTTAPELPAETLANYCYRSMFEGCSGLTATPVLPAKTLVKACYTKMFSGCENLNNVICLAIEGISRNQTSSWLENVAGTGVFIEALRESSWLLDNSNGIPAGWTQVPVVPGIFSVSSTKKVLFALGNLQATTSNGGSTWTWSFASAQYACIGDAAANTSINGNGTVSTNGTVDLFGWVGANSSLAAYGINNNTTDSSYGNVTSEALKSDWGHNAITYGGNTPDLWRTLSKDEWVWLIGPNSSATPGTNCRTSSTVDGTANARFTYATINGTYKGMIVFPDSYTAGTPSGVTWGTINNCSNYTTTCTLVGWNTLEKAGCVFLPAAGVRNGTSMFDPPSSSNPRGNYWSSTSDESNANNAYSMHFYPDTFNPENNYKRSDGYSVRLVLDAN